MNIVQKLHNFFYSPYLKLSRIQRSIKIAFLSVKFFHTGEYSRQATALTYYTLFAIVPLVALFFGIAKGFAFESKLKGILSEKFINHQETLTWIYKFADTTLKEASGGIIAGVGVFILLGTVIMLASSIEDTFNMIWDLKKRRALVSKVSNYLALLVITPIMLIVASAIPVVEQIVIKYLAEIEFVNSSLPLLQFAMEFLPVIIACLLFSLIYCVVPNTKVQVSSAIIAGIFAGIIFYVLQNSLLFLQIMLSKYNTIYGSFSVVPLFLLWLQWSWLIVLFGAKLAYVHQNAKSGKFDLEAYQFSHKSRQIYALAITQLICRNFAAGRGGTSEKEILDTFELNRYRFTAILEELIYSKVIAQQNCNNKNDSLFLPAYPTEQLTPLFVFKLLNGDFESSAEPNDDIKDIMKRCDKLNQVASEARANRPLSE